MKKAFSIILAISMLFACLTSCGQTATEESSVPASSEAISSELISSEKEPYTMDGKTYIFLGSSVTYGLAAGGVSMVDLIDEKYGCTCVKLAVSGTTLTDNGALSYSRRLEKEAENYPVCDHLIVQLSTNDASMNYPLGEISDSKNKKKFNKQTIIGGMEYIIAFAQETWGCKVSFYTGTKYDSELYKQMVDILPELQDKWGIGVLDLYNDPEMNAVSEEDYNRYMNDSIHPKRAGYEEWWLPKFEEFIIAEGNKE